MAEVAKDGGEHFREFESVIDGESPGIHITRELIPEFDGKSELSNEQIEEVFGPVIATAQAALEMDELSRNDARRDEVYEVRLSGIQDGLYAMTRMLNSLFPLGDDEPGWSEVAIKAAQEAIDEGHNLTDTYL